MMTADRFQQVLRVITDFEEEDLAHRRGTCPSCGQRSVSAENLNGKIEVVCSECTPEKFKAAVRKALKALDAPPPSTNGVHPPAANGARPRQARPIDIYSAADLVGMDLPEPKEIVPGFVYEGFNVFAGKGKTGKSWYALDLAIAVASGGRALGEIAVKQGDVLYLALEDTKRRMKKRLLQRLQGEAVPPRLKISHEWPVIGEGCLRAMRKWLDEHPHGQLILVDVLKKVKPRSGKNRGVYDDDFDFAAQLKEVADEYAIGIVGFTHTRKAIAEDVFDEVNASSGLVGAADAIVVWHRPRGSDKATVSITGRDVDEEKADDTAIVLQWHKLIGAWTILGVAGEVSRSDERKSIIDLLERSEEPLGPSEIATTLEKHPTTTRVLLRNMVADGDIAKVGRGNYTTLARAQYISPSKHGKHVNIQPQNDPSNVYGDPRLINNDDDDHSDHWR